MAIKYWTDDLIKAGILEVVESLGLKRMPTGGELMGIGKNGLHLKIGRTKGYEGWSKEVGLPLKESCTITGWEYEKKAMDLLISHGFECERMTTKHPFDILVNGCLKIDVKVAKVFRVNEFSFHTFNSGKKVHTCDLFLMFAVDDLGEVERIFMVPSNIFRTSISVGKKSKWDTYIERWDLVKAFTDFYSSFKINKPD